MYLSDFPFYANETCDQMRDLLPIVPCPNSVCVKIIILHPNRQTCEQGPIIVRDCWSRIMTAVDKKYALSPGDLEQVFFFHIN
uniref:CRAL-TRIO domain-containing protein n=1 Tax=Ascaris lumbricoides TaxID=6252 RepID=A0A0M3I073_ASCLU